MITSDEDLKRRLSSLSATQRALLTQRLIQNPTTENGSARSVVEASIPRTAPERVDVTAEGGLIEIHPASSDQERMWFLHQYTPDSPMYCSPMSFYLHGALSPALLQQALQHVTDRHAALRTTFAMEDGGLMQRVAASSTFRFDYVPAESLGNATSQDRRAAAEHRIENLACIPIDLSAAPPLRVTLVAISPDEHLLLIVIHHIISDGWSLSNLCREISIAYRALSAGEPLNTPPLARQFSDYAAWLIRRSKSNALAPEIAYWKEKLAKEPEPLDIPTDLPRPAIKGYRGQVVSLVLDREFTTALKEAARKHNATLFMFLLATFKVQMFRYTGQTDLLVGVPIANRRQPEVEDLIGFFANTLAMRTDLSGDVTFSDVLERVKKTSIEAYEHQGMPFDLLVRLLQIRRDPSRTPLYQSSFSLEDFPEIVLELPGLEATAHRIGTQTSKFDLHLAVRLLGDGLRATLEFSLDLFQPDRGQRMLEQWRELLMDAVTHPRKQIAALNLLPATERNLVVTEWNRTESDYPRDRCIHDLFASEAKRQPNAVAVIFGDERVTYGDLNNKSDHLAQHLRAMDVGPDVLVGMRIPRSLEMVIALLGILKAGGTYWPLEDKVPEDRLRLMLADAKPRVILVRKDSPELLPGLKETVCAIEDLMTATPPEAPSIAPGTQPTDAAYVNYTSGSTGQPKAVAIPHRAVVRLVKETNYVSLSNETLMQIAPLSFDAATFEIWAALLNGGSLVLLPPEVPTLADIGSAIRTHGVTTIFLTSGLFHLMVDERIEDLKPLRQLLAGGDILSPEHVRKAYAALPNCKIINGYGPTENTTFTSTYTVTDGNAIQHTVPIGRPIANTQIYILDKLAQPVPIGIPGELYAGGDGVALGYLHQPQLTSERFVPNPFRDEEAARLYRTGDLARWRADGNIEFLGRSDSQIKIRGFRIELGEIEAVLRAQPEVRDVAVLGWTPPSGQKELVAYLVAAAGGVLDDQLLRTRVMQSLPEYMAPRYFVWLDDLPLNSNGKVDRNALPTPNAIARPSQEKGTNPISLLELELIRIWERLFQQEGIDRQDNFFALGGHSLLATRLVAEIDRLLQCKLPIAALFQSPTVELLARRLHDDNWAPAWSSLVPLQPRGARPVLFFLHGLKGDVYVFLNLAKQLGPDQPTYGIQGIGLDGKADRPATVEEAAAHYVKEIVSFQSEGPLYIAGYSIGGIYAYEVARQLHAMGRKVALLALFDTMPLGKTSWFFYGLAVGSYIPRRAKAHFNRLRRLPLREYTTYLRRRWPALRHWFFDKNRPVLVEAAPVAVGETAPYSKLTDLYRVLALSYRPRPYAGTVDMFVADDAFPGWKWYWKYLSRGGLNLHRISGGHHVILAEKHLPSLAKTLTGVLRSKQAIFSPNGRTDSHS